MDGLQQKNIEWMNVGGKNSQEKVDRAFSWLFLLRRNQILALSRVVLKYIVLIEISSHFRSHYYCTALSKRFPSLHNSWWMKHRSIISSLSSEIKWFFKAHAMMQNLRKIITISTLVSFLISFSFWPLREVSIKLRVASWPHYLQWSSQPKLHCGLCNMCITVHLVGLLSMIWDLCYCRAKQGARLLSCVIII